jgi:hypothetical protein
MSHVRGRPSVFQELEMIAYIDHNIWDYFLEFDPNALIIPDCNFIVSTENMYEVIRSGNTAYFDLFRRHKASYVELALRGMRYIEDRLVVTEDPDWNGLMSFLVGENTKYGHMGKGFLEFSQKMHGGLPDTTVNELISKEINNAKALIENQGLTGFVEDIDISVMPADPPGAKEFRDSINIDPCVIFNYPPHQAIDLIWEDVSKIFGDSCSQDSFFGIEPIDLQGYDVWPMYLKTVGMHTILNLLGYRSDKQLHKFRKTRASQSDASHIGFAIHSDYLITMDIAMGYKAEAIYSKLGINTKVVMPHL